MFALTRLFLIALCLSTTFAALPSYAQDENLPENMTYDPAYTGWVNKTAEDIRAAQRASLADKGFIKPNVVQVAIVHEPYMEDDQFGIQMAVPDMISGCYSLTPLEYEAKFTEPHYLDIKVKKYRRVPPEGSSAVRKCDQQNKMSTALMVLSKKDLMSKGTQEIRFSTEVGVDNYRVILDENHLELIPRSMMIFRAQNMAGPLKDRILYSFQSDKMVALQVPMAKPGEDLTNQILKFAQTRAMTPADPSKPAQWTGNGMAIYYFYDQNGHIIDQIGKDGYAEIGKVSVDRPYDGPEGRTTAAQELSVFVTRPGTQL
ncbi:MAG: hypothetical protein DI551_09125 [Micavibrio aeruginosavorus]|uniref:Uncharacterized protein n=1 Tax=Micavibrio aeruginosavorus TaxID=349221 RepID=A0A2W5MUU4_9BACT|nr:MAG: hypothetical protein DI551_09125 [Micavibrio aeruginosavorus]